MCTAVRARARRAPALQDRDTRCCVLISRLRSGVARCGSSGSLPPPALLPCRTPSGRGQPTPTRLGALRAEAAQPRSEHGRRFPAPRGRGGRADPGRLLRRTRPAPPRSHAGRPRPPPARPGPPLRRRPPSPRSPSPRRRIPLLPLLLLLRPRGCARGAPREPRVVPVGLPGLPAVAPRARITFLPGKSPPRIRRSPLLPSWEAARGRAELRRARLGSALAAAPTALRAVGDRTPKGIRCDFGRVCAEPSLPACVRVRFSRSRSLSPGARAAVPLRERSAFPC